MKIGDKVRFLSEVGGGVVAGFQGKNIVLVEDEDGFQIPTSITNVVVIDNDDYNIKPEVQTPSTVKDDDEDYDPADRPITFTAEPEERKGGDALSVYLGFVPVDIKEITNTKFEVYLINDSNYYIDFTYLTVEGTSWNLRSRGTVEPNTKLFIEEFGREVLNELERVAVQFVAYKKDKGFLLKPTVDTQLRIDTVKFYKLHTFQENDFFEQAALIYTLIENDKPVRPLVVDAKKLKIEMARKVSADNKSKTIVQHARKKAKDEPVVVDLHASEILDTIAGMSPADILNYQLDLFKKTMDSYMGKHGTKIVFIHGKGEGVLRHAIIHELNYRYKNCPYQDASFQEYGYGATQVTIK